MEERWRRFLIGSLCLLLCGSSSLADVGGRNSQREIGPGSTIVRGQFGGDIFGFDIDPTGTEGLLAEAVSNPDGTIHAAVETFDQATGAIISVVAESDTMDDFITLGIANQSVGLVERERLKSGHFNIQRTFVTLSPLNLNQINGRWTPPIGRFHVINQVKAGRPGTSDVIAYALDVSGNALPTLFTSNLSNNTFGSVFQLKNTIFTSEAPPLVAYDYVRNQAILGHDFPSPFILPPRLGFVDLSSGRLFVQKGLGLGVINGIAVDSVAGVLCTDTSFDSAVQFYNLKTRDAFRVLLPGAEPDSSLASGEEIACDTIHQLFLVAQPFSGTAQNQSSIQVYDYAGNLVESIDGLNFQGGFNVFPVHIALHPADRTGFVNGPDLTGSLQSFSY